MIQYTYMCSLLAKMFLIIIYNCSCYTNHVPLVSLLDIQRTKVSHLKGVSEASSMSKGPLLDQDWKSIVKSPLRRQSHDVVRLGSETPQGPIVLPKLLEMARGGDSAGAYLRFL